MQLRILLIIWIFLVFSCKRDTENTHSNNVQPRPRTVNVPAFNADSAYFFVKKQVSFGPRVPNTEAHRKTGDYLINTFRRFGAQVAIQEFESTTFDGQRLHLRNIIASFFPEKQKLTQG